MIYFGRIESAQADVVSAGRAGAQAAVVQSNGTEAQTAAETAIASTLDNDHVHCTVPSDNVDVANFVAGGSVVVTVTCVTTLADVTIPGVPGARTFTATQTALVDRYRTVS